MLLGRKNRDSEPASRWPSVGPPLTTRLTATSVLIERPTDIPEPEDVASEHNLYFEVLELQPIRLSLSFERTDRVSGEEK